MSSKRKSPPPAQPSASALIKRQRQDEERDRASGQELVVATDAQGKGILQRVTRTSGLDAPIMRLEGHQSEILDVRFDTKGQHLASCSADKTILLWDTYNGCTNYGILRPPTAGSRSCAITSLVWSPSVSSLLYSSSADRSVYTWDLTTGKVARRHKGHEGIVNEVDVNRGVGRDMLVSAGDDGNVKIWTVEDKKEVDTFELGYPVTAVRWSADGQQVFLGGVDNDVHCFDLRKRSVVYSLRGHLDTIASISVSPSGSHLLSTSFDSTCRIWDIRPFAPTTNTSIPGASPRLHRILHGAPAGPEAMLRRGAWDPSGGRVGVGSYDRSTTIWNVESGNIEFKLPGHKGTVTAVDFHPSEPVIVSASVDTTLYLGEIDPVVR